MVGLMTTRSLSLKWVKADLESGLVSTSATWYRAGS